jgi:hypothetical protein
VPAVRPDFAPFAGSFRPRVVSTILAVAWVAASRRGTYVTDGHLRGSVHFAARIALCQAAECVVTGIHGQPLHTGVGGLVVAADRETKTALLDLIGHQFPPDPSVQALVALLPEGVGASMPLSGVLSREMPRALSSTTKAQLPMRAMSARLPTNSPP